MTSNSSDSAAGPPPDDGVPPDPAWQAEFEAASKRPLALRWRYSFIKTYRPVLDDAEYRSFDTMAEYRKWCEENLPEWLGYGRAEAPADVSTPDAASRTTYSRSIRR